MDKNSILQEQKISKEKIFEQEIKKTVEMSYQIEKEIHRILTIARIYSELQKLIPNYESEYLDAYFEMAERFKKIKSS